MIFNPGDLVSIRGYAVPMPVESINGDDVTVREYNPKQKNWRRQTYKAAVLQLTPKRRAFRVTF
jgi:hypothetical protein